MASRSWDPGKNFSADCRAPAWDRIKNCRFRRFQLMLLLRFGRIISFQIMVVFFLLHPKVLPDFKVSRFLSLKLTNYSKIDLQIPEWKPRFLAHDIMSFTPPNLGFLWPSYRPRGFRVSEASCDGIFGAGALGGLTAPQNDGVLESRWTLAGFKWWGHFLGIC